MISLLYKTIKLSLNLIKAGYNQNIGSIIIAIIIYLAGFSRFFGEKIDDIKKYFANKRKEAENLEKVRQLVIRGEFHTSEYKSKIIYEPKKRVIYKLPFCPDRIVQHAVMNILKPILINLFIENTYACIEGRGQMRASRKCSEYVRKYKYCLKCDISRFYLTCITRSLRMISSLRLLMI